MLRRLRLPQMLPAALGLLGAADLHAATGAWAETPQARVRLVSRWERAAPGGDAGLGLELVLVPGWHVYWKNPGDAGYPPEVVFAPGTPLADVAVRFPAPARFELPGDLVAIGYEHEVIYPLDGVLTAAAADAPTAAALAATVDFVVCARECIPYRVAVALDLPLGTPAEDAATAPRLDAWRSRLPRPAGDAGLPAVAATLGPEAGGVRTLALVFVGGPLRAVAPDLFFASQNRFDLGRPRFVAAARGPGFEVPLRRRDVGRPWPERLELAWTATGFDGAAGAVAYEGTLDLATAAPPGSSGAAGIAAAAIAATVLTAAALIFRRRRFRSDRSP